MSASSATAMYLTHYLESLENLPVELQRNFSLMRDLDSKSQATMQEIDRLGNEIFSKGPSLSPERKREIKIKVSKLFTKSKALGDDKVQLALQTYELVDKHIRRLDSDLARFETEIKNGGTGSGVIGGLVASGGGVGGGGSSVPNSPLVSEESEFVAAPTVSSSTSNKKRGRKRDKDTMMMSSGTTTGKNNRLKSLAAEAGALGSRSGSGSGSESPARKKHRSGTSGGGAGAGSGTPSSEIQLAAIAAAGVLPSNSASDTSLDMPVDPNEPTYCICQQVSYGEMIACDNPDCPIEWFHMSCMGIVTSPKGKWFCPKCTPNPPVSSGGAGIKKK